MIKRLWHELLYRIIKLTSVKNDLGYTQKTIPVTVNKVKTMSKPIEVKENNRNLSTISLFSHMTDEDFLAIHNAGQLKNLCNALSLDLHSANNKKTNTYIA